MYAPLSPSLPPPPPPPPPSLSPLHQHTPSHQAFITKPKYCVPFLQPGRLVRVEHGDDEDFGWGTVINFQKKANQKVHSVHTFVYTVESLSNGMDRFVLPLYRLVHWKVSFMQRCPLFRVSFIRGSTVYRLVHWKVSFIQSVLYQRFHCI